jgi:hypothetical protein
MSDPQTKLGQLIEGEQLRDAVHIAVAPVIAVQLMKPGTHVGLDHNGQATPLVDTKEYIGIVDPFLPSSVKRGDTFWLFLYPNTITSLKHVWTHPVFDNENSKAKQVAEAWLREFAIRNYTDYDYIIQCAKSGEEICFGNEQDELNYNPLARQKFWDNLELVTGRRMTPDQRETEYFRCAC